MLRKLGLLDRLVRVKTSGPAFLEQKYLRILRRRYGLSPDAVGSELKSGWMQGKSLLEIQNIISDQKQSHPKGPLIFNGYWRQLLDDALAALPKETGLHDATIYIGEAPDPIFNAEVQDFGKDRFLILVQSGLELFLYRIACVIVASMRLRIGASGPEQTVMEPEIDMDAARSIVIRNVDGVFRGTHEWPIALKSETALAIAASYAYALQQFVVAHEIGHILQSIRPYSDRSKGERKPPLNVRKDSEVPGIRRSWRMDSPQIFVTS